jgi:hypothetical protein
VSTTATWSAPLPLKSRAAIDTSSTPSPSAMVSSISAYPSSMSSMIMSRWHSFAPTREQLSGQQGAADRTYAGLLGRGATDGSISHRLGLSKVPRYAGLSPRCL